MRLTLVDFFAVTSFADTCNALLGNRAFWYFDHPSEHANADNYIDSENKFRQGQKLSFAFTLRYYQSKNPLTQATQASGLELYRNDITLGLDNIDF